MTLALGTSLPMNVFERNDGQMFYVSDDNVFINTTTKHSEDECIFLTVTQESIYPSEPMPLLVQKSVKRTKYTCSKCTKLFKYRIKQH